jgi:hypothetical protein
MTRRTWPASSRCPPPTCQPGFNPGRAILTALCRPRANDQRTRRTELPDLTSSAQSQVESKDVPRRPNGNLTCQVDRDLTHTLRPVTLCLPRVTAASRATMSACVSMTRRGLLCVRPLSTLVLQPLTWPDAQVPSKPVCGHSQWPVLPPFLRRVDPFQL